MAFWAFLGVLLAGQLLGLLTVFLANKSTTGHWDRFPWQCYDDQDEDKS
jgi:hypothetical protein